jgi:sirohydrochlorin ferrochelatase
MNRSGMRPAEPAPPLVAVAHGTTDPAGAAAIRTLIRQIGLLRPGLDVIAAFLSNGAPSLDDALSTPAVAGRASVVVPLLLSSGYHVRHDIPRIVSARREPHDSIAVTSHLGPDPLVIDILADRVARKLGARPLSASRVVLAAAGSRDPQAACETAAAAQLLSQRLGCPVRPAYVTTTEPPLGQALEQAGRVARGGRVIVATYLLAPGEFERRIHAAAANVAGVEIQVTGPLAPDPRLARLVLERYDASLARRPAHAAELLPAA